MHIFHLTYVSLGFIISLRTVFCRGDDRDQNCDHEFTGTQTCQADIPFEAPSDNSAEVEPTVDMPQRNRTFWLRWTGWVRCIVTGGRPKAKINWFKDGVPLESNKHISFTDTRWGADLVIHRAVSSDAGFYKCQAVNPVGSTNLSSTEGVRVSVVNSEVKPTVDMPQKNRTFWLGWTGWVRCIVTGGRPKPRINWFKDGVPLESDKRISFTDTQRGADLTIRDAVSGDAGLYKCQAVNKIGSTKLSSTDGVRVSVVNSEVEPTVYMPQSSLTFWLRWTGWVRCIVTGGRPKPTIKWFKDGVPVESNKHISFTDTRRGADLTIRDAVSGDAGLYKCQAVNKIGTTNLSSTDGVRVSVVNSEVELTVYMPQSSLVLWLDRNGRVRCIAAGGHTNPTINWFKDGVPVESDSRVSFRDRPRGADLIIHDAVPSDAGLYQCQAVNAFGSTNLNSTHGVRVLVLNASHYEFKTHEQPCPTSTHCLNGGTCYALESIGIGCICPEGYTGQRCADREVARYRLDCDCQW